MSLHCEAKKPYSSPQAAARAARGRARDGVTYLRVYECPECGMFHLTSKAPIEPGEAAKRQSASGAAAGWGPKPNE